MHKKNDFLSGVTGEDLNACPFGLPSFYHMIELRHSILFINYSCPIWLYAAYTVIVSDGFSFLRLRTLGSFIFYITWP